MGVSALIILTILGHFLGPTRRTLGIMRVYTSTSPQPEVYAIMPMGLNMQTVDPNSFLKKYLKPVSAGQQIMNVLDSELESLEAQLKDTETADWAIIGTLY